MVCEALGTVLVAWADTSVVPEPESIFDRVGQTQFRRFRSLPLVRAHRFLVARALAVELADALLPGSDLRMTTTCGRCGGEHGRPRFERAPIALSIAYAQDVVVVAVAPVEDAVAVGVDIEREPPGGAHARLEALRRLFAPACPPDTAEWTLLEAAAKANGRGLDFDLSAVVIGDVGSGRDFFPRRISLPGHSSALYAVTLRGPAGYVVSAAVSPKTAP